MSRSTLAGEDARGLTAQTSRRLNLGTWRVRLRGPASVVHPLTSVLEALRVHREEPAPLDLRIAPDGRAASGLAGGGPLWSIPLPSTGWLATLVGRTVASLTSLLTRLLFVHASAVAVGSEGWAIVGESGTGKTSLAAALIRGGARYLSDDLVLVDPADGTIQPVLIPLGLKPWTLSAVGDLPPGREVASDEALRFWMPDAAAGPSVRCSVLVFLGPARGRVHVTPLSRAQALLAVARQTSSFTYRHRAEEAFVGFGRVVREARCLRVAGSRAAMAAADLLAAAGNGGHQAEGQTLSCIAG